MPVAPELSFGAAPDRRAQVERWRRRSRMVRQLRVLLPVVIALIVGALVTTVAYNTLTAGPAQPKETSAPIRLVNPRFVGRDERGRAFVITAETATRDQRDYQRVLLHHPALVMDEQGPDPLRLVAREGVYHEGDRKLDLHGGVRLVGAKAAFDTATSLFDTRTGEVVGSGPIQGSGSLGEITAKSYAIQGKGDRMIFTGGVRTRLDRK